MARWGSGGRDRGAGGIERGGVGAWQQQEGENNFPPIGGEPTSHLEEEKKKKNPQSGRHILLLRWPALLLPGTAIFVNPSSPHRPSPPHPSPRAGQAHFLPLALHFIKSAAVFFHHFTGSALGLCLLYIPNQRNPRTDLHRCVGEGGGAGWGGGAIRLRRDST